MTPQELKNSILQMAIQGRLVDQRPEEGTAEKLYQQIQEEKQRLVKAGKIKKEKPLPEIAEDEKPFEIPGSWKWVRIGQIFNLQAGKNITSSDIYEGISPEHRYSCYGGNGIRGYVSNYNREGHFALIGRQGALCGNINIANGQFYATEHAVVVDHYNLTDVIWGSWFLKAINLNQYATATAQPGLAVANIIKVLIPLPPLAEQKRIVNKIEELLPYIDRYEQAWSRLNDFNNQFPDNLKKSILQMAIQGNLVEQRPEEGTAEELYQQIQEEKQKLIKAGKIKKEKPLLEITEDEKPFDIPANWIWVRFGEIGSYKKGPFGSALTKSMFVAKGNDTVKVYEQKNAIQKNAELGEYYITREYFESKMKGFEVFPGDVIVSCAGTIGETYVMPENLERGIINQALMRMKLFGPIYIPYFLVFFDFVLKKDARSNSKGSAIKNIPPFEILKNYLVPLPPLAEQKRIVDKLEELLSLCEMLK